MNIQTVTFQNLTFLDVHNPQELELKYLRQEYNFNQLDLDDFVSRQQIPKIEIQDNYTLVVLDFPFIDPPLPTPVEKKETSPHNEKKQTLFQAPIPPLPLPFPQTNGKRRRIRSGHVNFFIGKEYLVILHTERTPLIDTILEHCQKSLKNREDFMGQGAVYLFYKIVDALVDNSFAALSEITTRIDDIDKRIVEDKITNLVEDISVTRRNIVVFQTMYKPALSLFSELHHNKYETLDHNVAPWDNVLDHVKKIWDRLEDNRELIEGISTSHESLLTSRTNEIVKVLTMFTAILLPLTLLASMYGMNLTHLPLASNSNSFLLITLLMLFMGLIMVLFFKIKNWL